MKEMPERIYKPPFCQFRWMQPPIETSIRLPYMAMCRSALTASFIFRSGFHLSKVDIDVSVSRNFRRLSTDDFVDISGAIFPILPPLSALAQNGKLKKNEKSINDLLSVAGVFVYVCVWLWVCRWVVEGVRVRARPCACVYSCGCVFILDTKY